VLVARLWPSLPGAARRTMGWSLAGLAALMAAVFVVFSFPNPLNYRDMRLAQRFASVFDLTTPSMQERLFFFSVSGRMIAANPVFGDGPGTFRLNFYPAILDLQRADERAGVLLMTGELKGGVAEHAHCDYLEIWAETGTVGIASLLFAYSVAWVWFARTPLAARDDPDGEGAAVSLHFVACFAAAAAIFINAAFSFPLHLPVRASLAWVLTACFFASARRLRELP
jgi:O-antigen ligase